jgi:copper chaperone
MARMVFDVPDMSCDHCVRTITRALEESGFRGFSVSLETKTVSLETDDPGKVRKVLEEAGYPASLRG